jgi:sugar phosphate isomerase/epimerase
VQRWERLIRSVNFPVQLYAVLDAEKEKQEVTNRDLVDKALDEHLDDVVKLCAEAGFAKQEGKRKLVRLSMTIKKDDKLKAEADKLGLEVTTLLLLCLRRAHKLRANDRGREAKLEAAQKRFDAEVIAAKAAAKRSGKREA